MFKKIKIKIKNIYSENDRALIETEVDILKGVKDIIVDDKNREAVIGFEDDIISLNKISETIEKLGFDICRYIGIKNYQIQASLTAITVNLKRMMSLTSPCLAYG